jgi:hypothetical protein
VPDFAGNVPAAGMGFKWDWVTPPVIARSEATKQSRLSSAVGFLDCFATLAMTAFGYAMNIRAAEAIVSNAPKAMKIFPISEV